MRKKKTFYSDLLPQRIVSHEIDSMALRYVRRKFPSNWLDRDLSERDYGIDLAVEIFKKNVVDSFVGQQTPTGWISFLQVKGTTQILKSEDGYVKFPNFPIRTLIYANQFKIPFFIIVVYLNQDKKKCYARYLWLQDYIEQKGFGHLQADWEKHKSLTLYIPNKNVFLNGENTSRFEESIKKDHFDKKLLEFIREYYIVKHYTDDFKGLPLESIMDIWLHFLSSLMELSCFELDDVNNGIESLDLKKVKTLCKRIKKNKRITDNQFEFFNDQLSLIECIIEISLGFKINSESIP